VGLFVGHIRNEGGFFAFLALSVEAADGQRFSASFQAGFGAGALDFRLVDRRPPQMTGKRQMFSNNLQKFKLPIGIHLLKPSRAPKIASNSMSYEDFGAAKFLSGRLSSVVEQLICNQ
jgi:hypothetical protein